VPAWLWVANGIAWAAAAVCLARLWPRGGKRPGAEALALALVWLLAAGLLGRHSARTAAEAARERRFRKHYVTGLDARTRGDLEQAQRSFEEALAVRPDDPETQRQLGELAEQRPVERREQARAAEITPAPPPPGERPGRKPPPVPHLPSPFEITHYGLDVALEPAKHSLAAVATLRVRSRGERLDRLELSLNPEFHPSEATFDGAPAAFRHTNDLLAVTPPAPLAPGREAVLTVRYRRSGPPVLGDTLDLISPRACYLRSETRWYPATGELDFRAPVRLRATVPAGYTVVAAGSLRGKERVGNQVRFHWETDRPASMVSLAAARYEQRSVSVPPTAERPAPLPLTCYTFPEHRDRAAQFLKEGAAIVRAFERLFGPYPYEKLGIVEIPLFPGGYGTTSFVMLIEDSFAERRLDREFLAHEIAHQWWGNSVFPQGLGAAWLSEAFANYSAWVYAAGAAGNPRVLAKRVARATQVFFREAAEKGEEPILETDVYRPVGARNALLYEKGAVVLHMLRREMGDAAFFRLLRAFADRHRHGKADIPAFRALASETAGRDLGWFFDQWLGRPGGPRLTYAFETTPDGAGGLTVRVTVTQPAPAFRARLQVALELEGDAGEVLTRSAELSAGRQVLEFPVPRRVRSVLFDPAGDLLMQPPRWQP